MSVVQQQHEEMRAIFEVLKRARAVAASYGQDSAAVAMLVSAIEDLDETRGMVKAENGK